MTNEEKMERAIAALQRIAYAGCMFGKYWVHSGAKEEPSCPACIAREALKAMEVSNG